MGRSLIRRGGTALAATALLASMVALFGAGSHATSDQAALAAVRTGHRIEVLYRALPFTQAVSATSLERTVATMRRRIALLHVHASRIESHTVGGQPGVLMVLTSVTAVPKGAAEELGNPDQLYFYDWEPNVIGANGEPAPKDKADTGGIEPGSASAGLPEYRAVLRASKRPAVLPPSDSDLVSYTPGCTPQGNEATSGENAGCLYGHWYLLDESSHRVLAGPAATRGGLYADGLHTRHGAKLDAVHVNPGTVLVHALEEEPGGRKAREQNRWYVLNDNPVLTGNDMINPRQEWENYGQGAPDVAFDFTSHGRQVFEAVTKEIAKRGENAAVPGVSKKDTLQHFAIALDDHLITVPSIDWRVYPEGINAKNGTEITGGFTLISARALAAELQAGALPLRLELVSVRRVRSS